MLRLMEPSNLSDDTLNSFIGNNKNARPLRKLFKLPITYQIIPYEKIERLFDMIDLEGDWKTFDRMYPGSDGYLTLSSVGFNAARDQAFLSTGWMCGSLCGEGHYVVLHKNNGEWKVVEFAGTWMV